MKKTETFVQKIERLVIEAKTNGQLENERHRLVIGGWGYAVEIADPHAVAPDGVPLHRDWRAVPLDHELVVVDEWTIRVFARDSSVHAYSTTKADFEPSLREFIEDYFA